MCCRPRNEAVKKQKNKKTENQPAYGGRILNSARKLFSEEVKVRVSKFGYWISGYAVCLGGFVLAAVLSLGVGGCGEGWTGGYSNEWLYPDDVSSVYVEMFDNRTLRRGHEYNLTDAIGKRIEAQTPYKIVSDRSRADTVISGQISSIGQAVLTGERKTGSPLERQFGISAVVDWKNLKTGEILVDNRRVSASVSFSTFQEQGEAYASAVATNRLAERIVEMMQKAW